MKVSVKWQNNVCFVGESDSGHQVMMDGPAEDGGQNQGFRPMELLLLGLGGCTSFDVVTILKKSRQLIEDCEVQIEAQRSDQIPAVFTQISLHFKVMGRNLNEKLVARAVKLSAEKYCSASLMLEVGGVDIDHTFEIAEER